MAELAAALGWIAPAHRLALEWFHLRRGEEITWPEPLPDGTFLVNRAKGIHKPRGWRYALSVREVVNGPYADAEPELRNDGSWGYRYLQEGRDPGDRDRYFTNRGLMACMDDGVPVGVLRQVSSRPKSRYVVLGLGRVTSWDKGWFTLSGPHALPR